MQPVTSALTPAATAPATSDCHKCLQTKAVHEFKQTKTRGPRKRCIECFNHDSNVAVKKWAAKNVNRRKIGNRISHLKDFGLTVDEYADMLSEQSGVCRICGLVNESGRRLGVDHCHRSGNVRGLLCSKCNVGLGQFKDDPVRLQSAIDYLERYT